MKEYLIEKTKRETHEHIEMVRDYIGDCITELLRRAKNHDQTKLEEPELSGFAENTGKLEKTVYGSPEYQKLLDELKPTLEHHYSRNSHHPQYYLKGIEQMDLFDIQEMLVDWLAATKRMSNGNIYRSIDKNTERFEINPQLAQIMKNTIERHFSDKI